jgi:hypothetical protein
MKKVLKITIILIMIFTMYAQVSVTFAAQVEGTESAGGAGTSEWTGGKSNWSDKSIDWWKPTDPDIGESNYINKANIITTVIRNIGIVVSVIALMIIGIREMTASAEEKSIIKQSMPGYILGAVMVGAISFLPSLIYNIVKNF